jgi:phosphatidylglycerophosphate synthase
VRYLTLANQLTILRIMLIPAFVLLIVYGYLGWALLVVLFAGVTDALDGLIARVTSQRTSLGAWLDPMADKLLLVTTFVVLTLPQIQLTNHVPLWLTVLIISRDIVIIGVVAIVNLAVGPRTFHLHHRERCVHVLQLVAGDIAGHRRGGLDGARRDAGVEHGLLLQATEDDQRSGVGGSEDPPTRSITPRP